MPPTNLKRDGDRDGGCRHEEEFRRAEIDTDMRCTASMATTMSRHIACAERPRSPDRPPPGELALKCISDCMNRNKHAPASNAIETAGSQIDQTKAVPNVVSRAVPKTTSAPTTSRRAPTPDDLFRSIRSMSER